MNPGAITDVDGILVGHHHRLDPDAALGSGWACGSTVVLAPPGTVGAVDVRGGALAPGAVGAWLDEHLATGERAGIAVVGTHLAFDGDATALAVAAAAIVALVPTIHALVRFMAENTESSGY